MSTVATGAHSSPEQILSQQVHNNTHIIISVIIIIIIITTNNNSRSSSSNHNRNDDKNWSKRKTLLPPPSSTSSNTQHLPTPPPREATLPTLPTPRLLAKPQHLCGTLACGEAVAAAATAPAAIEGQRRGSMHRQTADSMNYPPPKFTQTPNNPSKTPFPGRKKCA